MPYIGLGKFKNDLIIRMDVFKDINDDNYSDLIYQEYKDILAHLVHGSIQ